MTVENRNSNSSDPRQHNGAEQMINENEVPSAAASLGAPQTNPMLELIERLVRHPGSTLKLVPLHKGGNLKCRQ